MKKNVLTLLFMALFPMAMMAYDAVVDGIYYDVASGYATVTHGDNPYTGEVDIPEKILTGGVEYTVKSIGEEAFWNCSGLTSVTIPSSVTSIGYDAFYNCSGLTSVTILQGVSTIGDNVFRECTSLTSVTIHEGVTSIGYDAFWNTPFYNNLPNGLIYLGSVAYKYKGEMSANTEIVIKDGTKSIGCEAFSNCSGLTSVTIPLSVTSIGRGAFNTTGLYENAPDGVFYVDNWVCGYKGKEPEGFLSLNPETHGIADGVFSKCYKLRGVTIPEGVKRIGARAFSYCDNITSITIPSSVKSIGSEAFFDCI